MSQGADIAFPHLGITIGHLPKGITIGGFTIAFYGIIIACGMLAGLDACEMAGKREPGRSRMFTPIMRFGELFLRLSEHAYIM